MTRTQRTFETLSRMERYRGHFFNWYDTRSLAPLHPRYVSMVDSGNLAANLLVLGSGCAELSEARILPPRMFGGLRDTLRVLLDVARGTERPLVGADVLRKIERQIEDLEQAPATLGAANALLSRLTVVAAELTAAAGERCGACLVGERLRAVLQRSSRRPAAPGGVARLAGAARGTVGARRWRATSSG